MPNSEDDKERVKKRVLEVIRSYSSYAALTENGVELIDEATDLQIRCPWHGVDERPSARYYGGSNGNFHCFACKLHLNSVGIYAKFKNIKFMQALTELERRFNIKPEGQKIWSEIEKPVDKSGSKYESESWGDLPRLVALLENKLIRVRNNISIVDFVRWCRIVDAVQWDFDHNEEKSTPEMIQALLRVKILIDNVNNSTV
jgi:hypothetical protein